MPSHTKPITTAKPTARSRVSNGSALLPGVDGRSCWARRFRDLIALHTADLGGSDYVTAAEASIIRRAAAITVELERLEQRFATDDATDPATLDQYQRAANSLRRLLESVGLKRRITDVTPSLGEYIEGKAQ